MVLDIEGEMLFSSVNLSQSLNGLTDRAKQAVSKIDPDEFLHDPTTMWSRDSSRSIG